MSLADSYSDGPRPRGFILGRAATADGLFHYSPATRDSDHAEGDGRIEALEALAHFGAHLGVWGAAAESRRPTVHTRAVAGSFGIPHRAS